jgi:hypothetical protein
MTTQQIETPASGPPLRSAQEAFQNHEDRMQALEAFGHLLGEAFPHLRDAAGLPRHPHQFTKDMMKDMLTKILGRLPQLPEGNAEADAPTPGPAW